MDIYNPNSQLEELNARKSNLSVIYLDTQCMNSTFSELLLTVQIFQFDMWYPPVSLSEIWFKSNHMLLDHVSITGYIQECRNRDGIKGGSV